MVPADPTLVWVVEDVTMQRLVREQPGWKAMHDPLTLLPNREAFAMRLHEWLQECSAAQRLPAEALQEEASSSQADAEVAAAHAARDSLERAMGGKMFERDFELGPFGTRGGAFGCALSFSRRRCGSATRATLARSCLLRSRR